jgi:hypothetical protein
MFSNTYCSAQLLPVEDMPTPIIADGKYSATVAKRRLCLEASRTVEVYPSRALGVFRLDHGSEKNRVIEQHGRLREDREAWYSATPTWQNPPYLL